MGQERGAKGRTMEVTGEDTDKCGAKDDGTRRESATQKSKKRKSCELNMIAMPILHMP